MINRIAKGALAVAILFTSSCAPKASDSAQKAQRTYDLVIHGGPIYTNDDSASVVEAVGVINGAISTVGAMIGVKEGIGKNTRMIDLNGAAMYPGFTDAHAHLIGIGQRELTLNLEDVGSITELVSIVAANVQHTGDDETIYGRGWIETGWPEGRMPTRDDLDPVSADNPVLLERADGHAMVANSAALTAAGVDDATPDPEGGRIDRDENGRATGLLIDNASNLVADLIATPSTEQKSNAYIKGGDVYAAYGWTGLHNMSVNPGDLGLMEKLSDEGVLGIRVYNSIDNQGLDALIDAGGRRASNNTRIRTNALKLYVDGALGSRGAALSEPYSDAKDTKGLLLMQENEAHEFFDRALANGIQVNTHAIGDRGNKLVLDWYEKVFSRNPDAGDLRWRIEHSQILHVEDIPRFAALGVIPSMQPSHAIGDLHFAPDRLGPDRLAGAYAWRALIDAGSIIAGGSDAPVERGNPLIEFYAAVARRDLKGFQGENWTPEQAVTREEALKMFTSWPAYAAFQENELGTIEVGKRADFTVFSDDIMTIAEEEIPNAKAVLTIVDGKVIYAADQYKR